MWGTSRGWGITHAARCLWCSDICNRKMFLQKKNTQSFKDYFEFVNEHLLLSLLLLFSVSELLLRNQVWFVTRAFSLLLIWQTKLQQVTETENKTETEICCFCVCFFFPLWEISLSLNKQWLIELIRNTCLNCWTALMRSKSRSQILLIWSITLSTWRFIASAASKDQSSVFH